MSIKLPAASTKEKPVGKTFRISIDKDLNFYWNKTQVPFESLDALLKENMTGLEDAKVEIAVDETVPYKYFVEVADLVSVQNGFKMVLVTQNKK
jgi:biopolymer transport protein ExbD